MISYFVGRVGSLGVDEEVIDTGGVSGSVGSEAAYTGGEAEMICLNQERHLCYLFPLIDRIAEHGTLVMPKIVITVGFRVSTNIREIRVFGIQFIVTGYFCVQSWNETI